MYRKKLITLALFSPLWGAGGLLAQSGIVVHNDLLKTEAENSAYRQARLGLYNQAMDSIKSYKEIAAGNWAVIQQIQQKIYSGLTNVDDAIKQSKELEQIVTKTIPAIFNNLAEAGALSVQKPYLAVYWNGMQQIIINKVSDLATYITTFITSVGDDPSMMIHQTDRDQVLWQLFNRINTIYNITCAQVNLFKLYNLQTAINAVVPLSFYKSFDASIVNNTLTLIKLF
jgi:hypothetical protein